MNRHVFGIRNVNFNVRIKNWNGKVKKPIRPPKLLKLTKRFLLDEGVQSSIPCRRVKKANQAVKDPALVRHLFCRPFCVLLIRETSLNENISSEQRRMFDFSRCYGTQWKRFSMSSIIHGGKPWHVVSRTFSTWILFRKFVIAEESWKYASAPSSVSANVKSMKQV